MPSAPAAAPRSLGPNYATFDSSTFHSCAALWVAPVIFFSVPVLACLVLPSLGPALAGLIGALALLPRLLWRSTEPPEGKRFALANCIYWNLVYPSFFGSPILVAACCFAKPVLSLVPLCWLVHNALTRAELKSGQPWPLFSQRDWGIIALRQFLRLRLHVSEALRRRDNSKPVVVGIHPHGLASDYRVAMDGLLYEALPGRTLLTLGASVLFMLPLVRELCLWTRCIDARKAVAARALKKGHSLMVIPGGEAEQLRTQTGVEEVYLSKRVGFVKLAMQHGAALVPCYAFGTVDL